MKKIVCGFVFGLMLMVAGAQAWAEGCRPASVLRIPKYLVLLQVKVYLIVAKRR